MSTEVTTGMTTTDTGAESVDPDALVEVALVDAADDNQDADENTDQGGGQNVDQGAGQDQSTGQDMDPGCSGGGCPETGPSA